MKKVTFYCDICKKEIPEPVSARDSFRLKLFQQHDWGVELPMACLKYDMEICSDCATRIEDIIRDMKMDTRQLINSCAEETNNDSNKDRKA